MEKKRERKRIKVTSQIRQLSYDLKSTKKKPDEPGASVRLALFLGAGASYQSKIPVAGGMTSHFKTEIYRRFGKNFKSDEEGEKWLKQQTWHKGGESDYCLLFEECYKTESKRRSYIESIIERKQPSVGYIVLANLIKYGYLKTIITTNFDSLISLACSNYTDIFPVVYSLGNFASEMTVSSERPRILKIHGDFLFSKLKNTTEDLERPDENMERQVSLILEEYDGLIIIGYSGGDNSVMSIFEKIPDGKTIYWCDLSEDSMSERARKFLQDKKGTFVKIEGFDELMQVVRILIELDNASIVKTFQDRQVEINKKISEFEDVLLIDEENDEEIKDEETETFRKVLDKSREATQLMIEGNQAFDQEEFDKAEKLYNKAIELDPNNAVAYNNLGHLLYDKLNRPEEGEPLLRKAIELDPNNAVAYNNLGHLLSIN